MEAKAVRRKGARATGAALAGLPQSPTATAIGRAVRRLDLAANDARNRAIVDRLGAIAADAREEGDAIRPLSVAQLAGFFVEHPEVPVPKITMTPDGTLRARWIKGPGHFVAIEFLGRNEVRILAEVPRGRKPPRQAYAQIESGAVPAFVATLGTSLR
jgi:hypothetical protein